MPETRTLHRLAPFATATALCAALALWPDQARAQRICEPDDEVGQRCTPTPTETPTPTPSCDWECREYNRQQARERRAWKANDKGIKAMQRGEFEEARAQFNEALRQIPNYSYAQSNLQTLAQNEFYYTQIWGFEAVDRGEFAKARGFFQRAIALAYTPEYRANMQKALGQVDYLSRFEPAGSLLLQGTGAQTTWHVPADGLSDSEQTRAWMIREQLRLANRELPAGVDVEIFNMGMGIAVSTSEAEDLFRRVLDDQWATQPVPRSGLSGYNGIKGKRFDLLGCHSNGAMTCLYALGKGDASARDVVLYGPQITPNSAMLWQRLLRSGDIRTLKIVLNEGDPIPSLAMAVNSYGIDIGALLFNSARLKETISIFAPSAQVEVRSCAFKASSPFACHRMTAYPQCKAGRMPARTVPGTKGFLGKLYNEPPPPNC